MDNGANSYRRYLFGDDKGIERIVREYKDGLILFLNQYVQDLSVAEELTEEVFFRLMTRKPRFSGKSSFKTWLYAIGRNAAVDHIRRKAGRKEIPVADLDARFAAETDLVQAYIKEEQKIALHRALENLPPEYRQILWLIYFEGLTNEEAAAVMQKNAVQIKNLRYRAKQALKEELMKGGAFSEKFG